MKKPNGFLPLTNLAIGSIIGAGFVSGREILSFFFGQDIILSCIFVMCGFFVCLSVLFCVHKIKENKMYFYFQPIILVANLIIMSGMLSALDSLQESFFSIDKKYPIFSVIALIVSNIVLTKGIRGIENVNFFIVPVIVIVIISVCLSKGASFPVSTCRIKPLPLFEYVGLNVFISAILFVDAGEKYGKASSIAASLAVSVILGLLIAVISISLYGEEDEVLSSDIPLLYLSKKTLLLYLPYSICLVFGIFSTLISSHYPLFCIVENGRFSVFNRILLSLTALLISQLGFYNIVKNLYPALGFIGGGALMFISILTIFSREGRQPNTSALPARRE